MHKCLTAADKEVRRQLIDREWASTINIRIFLGNLCNVALVANDELAIEIVAHC